MTLDKSKISEWSASEDMIQRVTAVGWGFFAKFKGRWKSYFLDGEEGVIKDEVVAREMYAMALNEPECEGARLIRIEPVSTFDRKKI